MLLRDAYWLMKAELERCDLLASDYDKQMCKNAVYYRAARAGLRRELLLRRAVQPTVVRAEAGALPLIVALIIGAGLLLMGKR